MPATLFLSRRLGLALGSALALFVASAAFAKQPADLAGTWELSHNRSATTCRLTLRPARSDKGDYFLGMPAACRHAMPGLETVGRWAMPDASHLTLDNPAGSPVLAFMSDGDAFTAQAPMGTYTLKPIGETGRSGFAAADAQPAPGFAVRTVASTHVDEAARVRETAADLAGRYAVMREKHDTGCMLTLDDKSRAKGGGERAHLAPGCRDQGIVIFDPSAWQLVKGELVLTARAGHKTHLEKQDDGSWQKDPKEGKPLGLKKL